MKPYTLCLIGLETIKDSDGNIKHYSETFYNNALTYRREHPDEDVEFIDARAFRRVERPMSTVWEKLRTLSATRPLTKVLFFGHSSSYELFMFSKIRHELPDEERYISRYDTWEGICFDAGAIIELHGCQGAGMRGERIEDSIAQAIANATRRPTYGFLWKSSQQKRENGGFFQKPDRGGLVKCDPL